MITKKKFFLFLIMFSFFIFFIDTIVIGAPFSSFLMFLYLIVQKKTLSILYEQFVAYDNSLSGKWYMNTEFSFLTLTQKKFIFQLLAILSIIIGLSLLTFQSYAYRDRKKENTTNTNEDKQEFNDDSIPISQPDDLRDHTKNYENRKQLLNQARNQYFLYTDNSLELKYLDEAFALINNITIDQDFIETASISELSAIQLILYEYAKRYHETLSFNHIYECCINSLNASQKLLELDQTNSTYHINYCIISLDLICQTYDTTNVDYRTLDIHHILVDIHDYTNLYISNTTDETDIYNKYSNLLESYIALIIVLEDESDKQKVYNFLFLAFIDFQDFVENTSKKIKIGHLEHFLDALTNMIKAKTEFNSSQMHRIRMILDTYNVELNDYKDRIEEILLYLNKSNPSISMIENLLNKRFSLMFLTSQ